MTKVHFIWLYQHTFLLFLSLFFVFRALSFVVFCFDLVFRKRKHFCRPYWHNYTTQFTAVLQRVCDKDDQRSGSSSVFLLTFKSRSAFTHSLVVAFLSSLPHLFQRQRNNNIWIASKNDEFHQPRLCAVQIKIKLIWSLH